MNRAVPDFGPYDAPLLVVGEAGGKHEGARGQPFVGPVGRRVREIITRYGLNADTQVRYANVIPVEMPTLPKTPYAMQAIVRTHWHSIEATLLRGEHRAVIAYGRAALWRLTGRTKITDEHGSVSHIAVGGREIPTVASIHPAAVMRSKIEAGWTLVRAATERACRYACGLEFDASRQAPRHAHVYNAGPIVLMHEAAVASGCPVAIDTEYNRDTKVPFLIGLSVDGENVCSVVPTGDTIFALRQLLDDPKVTKLLHHAPADVTSLAAIGIAIRPPIVDTLMMYATVFPDLPVGLARCALHLFDHWHEWKGMAHDDPAYNAIDVVATWRLYPILHCEMTRRGLWPVWQREARHVGVLCMAMEARGLAVDPTAQRKAVHENEVAGAKLHMEVSAHVDSIFAKRRLPYEKELGEVTALIETIKLPRLRKDRDPEQNRVVSELRKRRDRCKIVIERWSKGFDLGNNDHLRWLLYDADGLKLPVQHKDGRVTANADAIARLLALKRVQESPTTRTVLVGVKEYQHLKKMTNTFLLWDADGPSQAIDRQGVAHPEYRAFGTGTGRLAGGPDSDLGDRKVNQWSYNALNIPEETRRIYVPHPASFVVDTSAVTTEITDDDETGDGLAESNLQSV